MRSRFVSVCCGFALLVGACSASETATPTTEAGTETTISPAATAASTTAPAPGDAARILSVDPEAFARADALFTEMRAAFEANDYQPTREIALAQFDIAFGTDLAGAPGAFPAAPIDSSDILQQIDEIWDDFSAEEQQAIADRVRAEFEAAEAGGTGDDDFADEAAPTDSDGFRGPVGFASSALRQPAPYDEVGAIFTAAHRELISKLGGAPLEYSWDIGDIADASPSERGHIAIWAVQARPGFLGGLLDDLFDRTCPTVIYPVAGVGRAQLAAAIMHELFHCCRGTSGDRLGYLSTPAWFQEGVATWAGAQYSPSDLGAGWWNVFASRETFSLYRETYAAIGFWSQLAELLGGEAELWDRIPAFNTAAGIGNDSNLFEFITASLSRDQLATLAASALQQPAYGDVWEVSGHDVTTAGRTPVPLTVDSTTGFVSDAVSFARQKLVQYQISSRLIDDPWILKLSTDGLVATRWSSGDEFTYVDEHTTNFCIGNACLCPDGSEPDIEVVRLPSDATSVDVALTGGAASGAGTTMELVVLGDDCEEPEPEPESLGDGDTGTVVGTYRAAPEAIVQMFEAASLFGGTEGLDIAGANGDLLMTLRPDGTGSLEYENVTLFFNDGPLADLTINGGGEFAYGVGDTLRISGLEYELAVSSLALGPEPLTIGSDDLPGGSGFSEFTYGFSASRLVLESLGGTSGEVFFPMVWIKQ